MSDFDDDFDDEEPGAEAHTSDGKPRPNDKGDAYEMTSGELQQFFERHEQIEAEIKDAQEAKKELLAELKGRGFDKAAFTKVVKLMRLDKAKREKIEEERAVASIYLSALGREDLEDLL